MEFYYMIMGAIIALEGSMVTFYSYRTLENILRTPEYSLRMFALRDEATQSFRILGASLVLYGVLGTIRGVAGVLTPSHISVIPVEKVPIAVLSLTLIGVIYFLRSVSNITRKE